MATLLNRCGWVRVRVGKSCGKSLKKDNQKQYGYQDEQVNLNTVP